MSTDRHIDVHVHAFSKRYIDLLEQLGAGPQVIAPSRSVVAASEDEGLRRRLEIMDQFGIERQVLSMSAATPYFDDAADAARAARFINDEHAELCRRHPERFSFFATLPMPHVDAALLELQRAYDELGAAGVTFTTSIRGRALSEPAFADVWAEIERRAAVVFLHPPGLSCQSETIRESGLDWTIGAPIEDALCAMQLMMAGFPRRYPHVKIILPHLGGFIPFLRYRVGRGVARTMPGEDPPSVQMRKFWYDTASGEPVALRASVECVGAERILYGSDYPYWTKDFDRTVNYLGLAGLSDAELAGIRYDNARTLFEVFRTTANAVAWR